VDVTRPRCRAEGDVRSQDGSAPRDTERPVAEAVFSKMVLLAMGLAAPCFIKQRPIDMGAPERTNIDFSKVRLLSAPLSTCTVVPPLRNGLGQKRL